MKRKVQNFLLIAMLVISVGLFLYVMIFGAEWPFS